MKRCPRVVEDSSRVTSSTHGARRARGVIHGIGGSTVRSARTSLAESGRAHSRCWRSSVPACRSWRYVTAMASCAWSRSTLTRQSWRSAGASGMDVSLPWDAEVSGLHAELRRFGEEWTVADDGLSRNGTFLNGERIVGRQRLRPGDRLLVGQTVIAYCHDGAGSAETTMTAARCPRPPPISETQRRILIALCRPYAEGSEFAGAREQPGDRSGGLPRDRCGQAPPADPVRTVRARRAPAEPEAGAARRARAPN